MSDEIERLRLALESEHDVVGQLQLDRGRQQELRKQAEAQRDALVAAATELLEADDAYEGEPDHDERLNAAREALRVALANANGRAGAT